MITKTKVILITSILAVSSIGFLVFTARDLKADSKNQNVQGWAWSSTTGWISFNSSNCNPDDTYNENGTGTTNGNQFADCPNGSTTANYGVTINPDPSPGNPDSGKLSGFAWSENLGWIAFNPDNFGNDCSVTGGSCSNAQAKFDFTTKNISGWARVCSVLTDKNNCKGDLDINTGGWDGWIHFNYKNADTNYQVTIDTSANPAEFKNFAWSASGTKAGLGWISFNHENCVGNPSPDCPPGSIPDYKVWTTLNLNAPKVTASSTATDTSDIYCGITDYVPVTFNWDYNDPNGSKQSAYVVEVYDTSDKLVLRSCDNTISSSNPNGDPNAKCTNNNSNSLVLTASDDHLGWGQTYNWRIMVWNKQNASSSWSNGPTFTTIKHHYPVSRFTWLPSHPITDETVQFCSLTDDASCSVGAITNEYGSKYGAVPLLSDFTESESNRYWLWKFVIGTPDNSDKQNPTSTFAIPGKNSVGLQVWEVGTEHGGIPWTYGPCPADMDSNLITMPVTKPIPKIKEVPPL